MSDIDEGNSWTPWKVAPGFEVAAADGTVGLEQVDRKNFEVATSFRCVDERALDDIRERLSGDHDPDEADRMLDDARTFQARAERTDLASVPRFVTWFEAGYGSHTLAAIIHDRLITSGEPNSGALGSDVLADRFFRSMMKASGVPLLKRWVMWAAVALRTRWAARGRRRLQVILWVLLALIGIASFVAWLGTALLDWTDPWGLTPGQLLGMAAVLPFVAAPLWGRQVGAAAIGVVAAPWILPPALFALGGYCIYWLIESVLRIIDR